MSPRGVERKAAPSSQPCSGRFTARPPSDSRWRDYARKHHAHGASDNSSRGGASELFPLPPLPPDGRLLSGGTSRVARRRRLERQRAWCDANESIAALNALYGADNAHQGSITSLQAACQGRILSAARAARHDFDSSDFAGPEGAARELLGDRFDYGGHGCTVAPFRAADVSLPSLGGRAVELSSVLDSDAKELLLNFDTHILRDPEEAGQVLRDQKIGSYTDALLRSSPQLYETFLKSLADRNLLRWTVERKARITPFFVNKKGNKLRLVFDCRRANVHFQRAPDMEMGSAEAFSYRLKTDLSSGRPLLTSRHASISVLSAQSCPNTSACLACRLS